MVIPEDLGNDLQGVMALQRQHANFETDLVALGAQVQQVQDDATDLMPAYSGPNAQDIREHENRVVEAWRSLQIFVEGRKNRLIDAYDLNSFFNRVRSLLVWMADISEQMANIPKAR